MNLDESDDNNDEINSKIASTEEENNIFSDTSHINFTLAVLEEAAGAHREALERVAKFQKLVQNKRLRKIDNSYQNEYEDICHLLATSKQMTVSLRLAADEAASAVGRETALSASKKFEKQLTEIKLAFEVTAKHYEAQMRRDEIGTLLNGGEQAVELVNSKNKRKTAEEKQRESKEAANSLKRVTSMIMESIYSIEAANELLDGDEDNINRTGGGLDTYNNEASTANKTLEKIKAKEKQSRYELYAAFAFFVCIILYILVRRIPFLALFLNFFSNNNSDKGVGFIKSNIANDAMDKTILTLGDPLNGGAQSANIIEATFKKENEESNKYFLNKESKIILDKERMIQTNKEIDVAENSASILSNTADHGRICCMAMTANCLACIADQPIEDFCNTAEGKNLPGCSGENSVRIDDMMVEMEVDATALNSNNQNSDTNNIVESGHIEDGAARKHGNYGDEIKRLDTDYIQKESINP